MRIVCATLNSKFIHSSLSPWCLKAGIEAFCTQKHSVSVVESTINASVSSFVDEIASLEPELVSFSCYIWNISYLSEVLCLLKNKLSCPVVLGGPEVAYRTKEILTEYPLADYVLCGEGEWCFSSLVDALSFGTSLTDVEGLTYKIGDLIFENSEKYHSDTPPSPYCEDYFEKLNGRICYIESSRGCPYRCSYCLSGRLSGFRTFDKERIFEDIIKLSNSGTQTVKFVDRTFNADKNYANAILKFIKDKYGKSIKSGVCFHFEISGDILGDDTLDILKSLPVGICQLEIGIQSFNPCVLKNINRHSNLQKLCENIKKLISFDNMHIHTDLIAGLPGENFNGFVSGFNTAFGLYPHMLQLGFLKILHGADIKNQTDDFDCLYSQIPPYEVQSTNTFSEEEFKKLKYCECALDKLYNSGRFLFTTMYLIKALELSPFDFFYSAGLFLCENKLSMSETVKRLYSAFSVATSPVLLKEVLLCDIACSGANISLPDNLEVYHPKYKLIKKRITEKLKTNIRIVILESEYKVFVVRNDSDKDLRSRKPYYVYDINEFID